MPFVVGAVCEAENARAGNDFDSMESEVRGFAQMGITNDKRLQLQSKSRIFGVFSRPFKCGWENLRLAFYPSDVLQKYRILSGALAAK